MPTLREEIAQKVAPLLAPIPGASSAGADASYDPEFERIKAEVDKLSSVDNKEPSWRDIQELGASLLSTKSKDLRVASWLAIARLKLDGWRGFAESLVVYDGLVRGFWDTMYPEARRARGRVNAFMWMADLAAQQLQAKDVTAPDGEAVRACDQVLKELDQFLADKLGDVYGGPATLKSVLRDKVRAIPEAAAPPPPAPVAAPPIVAAPAAVEAAPVAAAPAASQATTADDAEAAVRENGRAIMAAASLMRSADPARATAYRLQRAGAWIGVENPPPAENGRTKIKSPPEPVQRRLTTMRDGQKWLELLKAAEDMTGTYLFWLDLHRMVALAMDRLGATFMTAREVLGRETVTFVTRLPSVVDLGFSDGTPFADAGTKSWLEEEGKRWGGASASGPSASAAAASAEDDEVAKRFADAQKMVTEGKIADGLAVGLALAARAPDARSRFRARLAVSRMALEGAKPDVARPMLEHLVAEVERHDLEAWEPPLCATLYASLLAAAKATRGSKPTPESAAREQALFDKLCRLDPASAIKLST